MTEQTNVTDQSILTDVNTWLTEVVIGLNLCPFAAKPQQGKQVHTVVSHAKDENGLLEELEQQLQYINDKPPREVETTLLIVADMLKDFYLYNQFLDEVDRHLQHNGWEGIFQVASFHPDYQFGGTHEDDRENLTNRSPYPILHIIREASLERAIANYPNPEEIPANNIDKMEQLEQSQLNMLFPYLQR